jgi:hypothetical protein
MAVQRLTKESAALVNFSTGDLVQLAIRRHKLFDIRSVRAPSRSEAGLRISEYLSTETVDISVDRRDET